MLGFNDAWRHEHKARLDLGADFAHVGATVIRYPWVWDSETDQELFDGIDKALAAGLQPILCPYSYANDFDRVGEFVAVLEDVGERYPSLPIEVLNEPNLPNYGGYSADEYAAVFRMAHVAIRSVVDRTILASGGAWSPLQKDSYWLRDFAGATADLDYVVSAHFYTGQQTELTPEEVVQNLLALQRKRHPSRELWCTEVGYPSGTLGTIKSSEKRQAAKLGRLVSELQLQGIDPICVHRLYDVSRSDTVKWGVKRVSGAWKPIAEGLRRSA